MCVCRYFITFERQQNGGDDTGDRVMTERDGECAVRIMSIHCRHSCTRTVAVLHYCALGSLELSRYFRVESPE